MTLEQVLKAKTFNHKTRKNSDGTPVRARVNGEVKTWKREPEKFCIPVKYGLKDCFYITNFDGYVGKGKGRYWQTRNDYVWEIVE